jgi:hypothetical protein
LPHLFPFSELTFPPSPQDLNITNQPFALGGTPGINSNYTLTNGTGTINFSWDEPGKVVGYDDLYMTSTVAGTAKFAAFISQLNVTYVPITNITSDNTTGFWSGQAAVPGAFLSFSFFPFAPASAFLAFCSSTRIPC